MEEEIFMHNVPCKKNWTVQISIKSQATAPLLGEVIALIEAEVQRSSYDVLQTNIAKISRSYEHNLHSPIQKICFGQTFKIKHISSSISDFAQIL